MLVYHLLLLAVPVIFAILFLFQPETPVYLIRKGKSEKVPKVFQQLRGKDYDASAEIKAIEEQIAKETQGPTFWEGMKSKAAKKATLICFMLMFYQQFSGINAVMFYTNTIFAASGTDLAPHWCVIIVGIVQVFVSAFSSWSMDKLGRKILMMASCGGVSLSCIMLGLFFSLKDNQVVDEETISKIGFLPVVSLIIFVAAICLGLGPIPWLASSEIFAPEVKARCGSAAGTFNWFLAFLVTRFYLNLVSAIGADVTFYIFAAIMVTGVFFVLFVMPETKGKTFSQIQSELAGGPAQ